MARNLGVWLRAQHSRLVAGPTNQTQLHIGILLGHAPCSGQVSESHSVGCSHRIAVVEQCSRACMCRLRTCVD
eukprot:8867329-Alexandrium_andersonii.AAC.1